MKYTTIIFAMLLIVSGCSEQTITGDVTDEPIVIGGLFAETGYGAEWGTIEKNAAILAIEEINSAGGVNGRMLKLVFEDTQTDELGTITAYNKLVHFDNIEYIVGPTWEASASALVPVAQDNEVIVISPSSYKAIEGSPANNLFSTYPPYGYEISSVQDFYEEKGWENYAVLYSQEFFSEIMKDIFTEEMQKAGWTVGKTYAVAEGAAVSDYRTALLQIQSQGVDAMYVPVASEPPKAVIMKQMKELGIDIPIISTGSTSSPGFLEEFGTTVEGIYYPLPVDAPQYQTFKNAYKERFGSFPGSPSAETSYDAVHLLALAMENGASTPSEVAQYLHNVEGYEGASSTITFTESGIVQEKKYTMRQLINGQSVVVS